MSFHISAKEIELKDGHWLKATLKNRNGDWVHSKLDLDQCIGNTDGWFIWGGKNYSHTARNFRLEEGGAKLVAELLTADQRYRELQGIDLHHRIENRDGKLHFLDDSEC
ncbi:Cyanovirin-N [Pyronema domesticum]|uniref:Similar to Cyanovirin-N homolog acc. no. Q5MK11 n=1 Tax=Pyronema omphalodes (strain CBS 100304) TaxID=1076935 RepID=U4LMN9_PYROM|nr:Cyanovirin-N [Pyronema domesticum]CCX15418.1 Similar to Cyanovirin-N homolog; acc. no. Q5MK11 [Pyronema omphalodes CBS 100304]